MAVSNDMEYTLPLGSVLHGKNSTYKIVKVLGHGSFGITYKATVRIPGMNTSAVVDVAIKEFFMRGLNGRQGTAVTCSGDKCLFSDYKAIFLAEARSLAELRHPEIVKVADIFDENNTAYYVMEFINGGSLNDRILAMGGLTERETVKYALQICGGLKYMHSRNMLHLDLKPDNIMLMNTGMERKAILIDFGLSRHFGHDAPDRCIVLGYGTPGYAPVEQSVSTINARSGFPATMDIYALGATLFKMVTGRRPPEAAEILNEGFPIEDLMCRNGECSSELAAFIKKCMSPLKKDRYQNIEECIEELSSYADSVLEPDYMNCSGKGFYKRKTGEMEYGTFCVEKVPVTSAIEFPSHVTVRVWSKNRKRLSYEIDLYDSDLDVDYYSRVKIWYDGKIVDEHKIKGGIPDDVRTFLIERGFLSTEHWECEEITTPVGLDFGYDVAIWFDPMDLSKGEFVRRVPNAHPDFHNLLLNEIEDLVRSTCLVEEIKSKEYWRKNSYVVSPKYEVFSIPQDAFEVSINYMPAQIGAMRRCPELELDYCFHFDSKRRDGLFVNDLKPLIDAINSIGIKTGPYKEHDDREYSEVPAKLSLSFRSKSKGYVRLFLSAFNTDGGSGNIYFPNMSDLEKSLRRICLGYAPAQDGPTIELLKRT